ncbi:MAG: SUMF1/EgtB/PvdO family nonheme iron enzyme [Myxococcota bacterium]|nr:SUMF1/EgtB/PvdO family nonheme iron enzyme [Myxococcota bacterium]
MGSDEKGKRTYVAAAIAAAAVAVAAGIVLALLASREKDDAGADAARTGTIAVAEAGAGKVLVPAGPFWRGHPDGPPHPFGNPDTHPMRLIEISAFRIDRAEVTVGDYRRCVDAGKCSAALCQGQPEAYVGPDLPATCVSWRQAAAYCAWAGGRLPTEAEWEKAARGLDGRKYPWGGAAPTCESALHNACGIDAPAPVGARPAGASPFGVLDMGGNVAEWTADWYAEDYYRGSSAADPRGPDSGSFRVVRGGSFMAGSRYMMTGFRKFEPPETSRRDLGFRCAFP